MPKPMMTPLDQILVPSVKTDEIYRTRVIGQDFSFTGLKALLGAAGFHTSGDQIANLAAETEVSREAARAILSDLSLQHFYDRPLPNDHGEIDDIMRVNYDIDLAIFDEMAMMTVGELKDWMQKASGPQIKRAGKGLTGVMISAVTKLMSVHDMVYNARKIECATQARTHLGLSGSLSTRIQPNHPTDDLNAITALTWMGLSMGNGDLLIGLNPADDTVDNIGACLLHLDKIRRQTGAPTQVCVLSHIRTQLACLEEGAPLEILFQSLAGTDSTLREAFDVTVSYLDQAWQVMKEKGVLNKHQFMYFETGQGSEISYGKHCGIDMSTAEALSYGLCRRYDPCMVNSVTGFIGPETHKDSLQIIYANLQDLFMGKVMGLPMGVSPCFTLHADASSEGQEIAVELLTVAGANYFMDIYMGVDRMLAYSDTSGHDDQTIREIHNLKPSPEFYHWALEKGIFKESRDGQIARGPNWGNPGIFAESNQAWKDLISRVPMCYGTTNAGPRMSNHVNRKLKQNIAVARAAAKSKLRFDELEEIDFRLIRSQANNIERHHADPDAGSRLCEKTKSHLQAENRDIQILITDGLSAEAVHQNINELLPVLEDGLRSHGYSLGQTMIAPHGRVKLSEDIANTVNARMVIVLLGERPGADGKSSRSLSGYLVYRLDDPEARQQAAEFSKIKDIEFENTVVPNIYYGGIPPMEAGSLIAERAMQIMDNKAAGNRLNAILGSRMGLSDAVRESKVESTKTGSTIRVHDFVGQKSISEADVMMLLHWGVKEILLSQRTIISPLAGDLLKHEGIKLRYNDSLAK
ncbi:ethanolamine ammonia-lyase subunit EutB [Endozoicomonas ascidiicola]|uniref:ethanolamine ammonia-lyase subunit EutB n=2 Tax=Endozoicomonas ascidiicola TaxID=1698521 RepID=UPI00082BE8F3|nr:ethanolamine ammonia-lyase subunit EutB [Endozoicomonas ascidiicola]